MVKFKEMLVLLSKPPCIRSLYALALSYQLGYGYKTLAILLIPIPLSPLTIAIFRLLVPLNGTIDLLCKSNVENITWLFNGNPLQRSHRVAIATSPVSLEGASYVSSVQITGATYSNGGIYFCNEAGYNVTIFGQSIKFIHFLQRNGDNE